MHATPAFTSIYTTSTMDQELSGVILSDLLSSKLDKPMSSNYTPQEDNEATATLMYQLKFLTEYIAIEAAIQETLA